MEDPKRIRLGSLFVSAKYRRLNVSNAMLFASLVVGLALPNRWTLAIGGDAMFNQIAPSSKPIAAIESLLFKAEAAIINLEIPLTASTTPTPKKSAADRAAKKQFILKADPKHVESLQRAGIDIVSLANNHGMDYGTKGAAQQRKLLDDAGILHAGSGENELKATAPVRFRSKNGVDFTFVSYLSFMADGANETCWPAKGKNPGIAVLKFGGSVDENDKLKIAKIVEKAESKSKFVIVAIHWGIERQTIPTPYQVSLARAFVDAGADLVLGHHPHVLQGAEIYSRKPIFYSLGNFVSTMRSTGAVFTLRFDRDVLELARISPIQMAGKVSLLSDPGKLAELKRFRKLCAAISTHFPNPNSVPPKIVL